MKVCSLCGVEFEWDDNREDIANEDLCESCAEETAQFEGDYNDLHPDETEDEFYEHEDSD